MNKYSYLTLESKGLTLALDNISMQRYSSKWLKDNKKKYSIKHIGRLFNLMLHYKLRFLNSYISFNTVADILSLNKNVNYNRLKSDVRKALRELYPSIEYLEDPLKGIKFTHIPKEINEGYDIRKGETKGFTQIPCNLILLADNEALVVFAFLEYFNGSSKQIYPSISTLMSLTGCRNKNTLYEILKIYEVTEEQTGLWKINRMQGGTKKHTHSYELSYITEEGQERYYYLDYLEEKYKSQLSNSFSEDTKKEQIV